MLLKPNVSIDDCFTAAATRKQCLFFIFFIFPFSDYLENQLKLISHNRCSNRLQRECVCVCENEKKNNSVGSTNNQITMNRCI